MTAKQMWDTYIKRHPEMAACEYEAWTYGCMPDELAQLTADGIKTATASAYDLYAHFNEEIPQAGEFSVVLYADGSAACIIRTTAVRILPFRDVPPEFARKEGEGDRTLDYWRNVHKAFFSEALSQIGQPFTEEMPVVCEEFRVIFP